MKRLVLLTLVGFSFFVAGCKLDKDRIMEQFCQSYPEVCQYLDQGE